MGKLFISGVPKCIQRVGLFGQRGRPHHCDRARVAGHHGHLLRSLYRFLAPLASLILLVSSGLGHLFCLNDNVERNPITNKSVRKGPKLIDCQISSELHQARARRRRARSVIPSFSVRLAYHGHKIGPDGSQRPSSFCHDSLGTTVRTVATDTKVAIPSLVVSCGYSKGCRLKGMTTMMTPVVPAHRERIALIVSNGTAENRNGVYASAQRSRNDDSLVFAKVLNVRVGTNDISLNFDSSKFDRIQNHVRRVKNKSRLWLSEAAYQLRHFGFVHGSQQIQDFLIHRRRSSENMRRSRLLDLSSGSRFGSLFMAHL